MVSASKLGQPSQGSSTTLHANDTGQVLMSRYCLQDGLQQLGQQQQQQQQAAQPGEVQDLYNARPPQSPGFWVGYGKYDQPEEMMPRPPPKQQAPLMCSAEMRDPLQPYCCQAPKVRPASPDCCTAGMACRGKCACASWGGS